MPRQVPHGRSRAEASRSAMFPSSSNPTHPMCFIFHVASLRQMFGAKRLRYTRICWLVQYDALFSIAVWTSGCPLVGEQHTGSCAKTHAEPPIHGGKPTISADTASCPSWARSCVFRACGAFLEGSRHGCREGVGFQQCWKDLGENGYVVCWGAFAILATSTVFPRDAGNGARIAPSPPLAERPHTQFARLRSAAFSSTVN